MQCYKCKNEIKAGNKYCGFCGTENLMMTPYPPPPSLVFKQMNKKVEAPMTKLQIILWIIIGIIIFIGIPMWYDSITAKPDNGCRRTTKEEQTITKLDGDVNSINTEQITGIQCPDGSFYPDP